MQKSRGITYIGIKTDKIRFISWVLWNLSSHQPNSVIYIKLTKWLQTTGNKGSALAYTMFSFHSVLCFQIPSPSIYSKCVSWEDKCTGFLSFLHTLLKQITGNQIVFTSVLQPKEKYCVEIWPGVGGGGWVKGTWTEKYGTEPLNMFRF